MTKVPSVSRRGCTAVMRTSVGQRRFELGEQLGPRERALVDDPVRFPGRVGATEFDLLLVDLGAHLRAPRASRAGLAFGCIRVGAQAALLAGHSRSSDGVEQRDQAHDGGQADSARAHARGRCRTAGSRDWCAASGRPPPPGACAAACRPAARARPTLAGARQPIGQQRERASDRSARPARRAALRGRAARFRRRPGTRPLPPRARARSPAPTAGPGNTSRSGAPGRRADRRRSSGRLRKKITSLAAHDDDRGVVGPHVDTTSQSPVGQARRDARKQLTTLNVDEIHQPA